MIVAGWQAVIQFIRIGPFDQPSDIISPRSSMASRNCFPLGSSCVLCDIDLGVASARNAGKVWNEGTVVYFGDRTESDTMFEYFNPSTNWHKLPRVSPTDLESKIAGTYSQGGNVWLNSGAISLVPADWLAKHSSGETLEVDEPNRPWRYVKVVPKE